MTPDQAAPYLSRVLNEWLPGEVARLLTTEAEFAGSDEGGMPVLAIAKVLERLLLQRAFFARQPGTPPRSREVLPEILLSRDIEIFRDIILVLLGRTAAPALPVLPATALAGGFAGFADAVGRAVLVTSEGGDELHVPIDEAQALEVFNTIRCASDRLS